MWTIDARCSNCGHKTTCEDRKTLYAALSPLANTLNTEPQFQESPGDGIIVMVCHTFVAKVSP